MTLEERQRYILEKGLKRRPPRDDRYENDSASGEDPLASAPSSSLHPVRELQQRQHTPKHSRVVATPKPRSVTPQTQIPMHESPQKSLAVVITPTPKKNREEFVAVGTDEPVPKRRASNTPPQATAPTPSSEKMNRRGRPKGWKPGMAYTDLRPRPHKPSNNTTAGPKRRGRPPKPTSPPPREVYRQNSAGFFAFLCEWEECKAELHNLATLRRHVHVVHGEEGSTRGCKWGTCDGNPAKETVGREFRKHIEEKHLIPMAWHVGDGPRHQGDGVRTSTVETAGTAEGDVVPRWLKDEDGKQVTEGIWEQELEDKATWRANRRKLRELLIRRDENLPGEEEEPGNEVGGETGS